MAPPDSLSAIHHNPAAPPPSSGPWAWLLYKIRGIPALGWMGFESIECGNGKTWEL